MPTSPFLTQLHPERVEVLDSRGQHVKVSRRHGFRLTSGQVYVLRIVLPTLDEDQAPVDRIIPLASGVDCSGDPIEVRPGDKDVSLVFHTPRRLSPLPSFVRIIIVPMQKGQNSYGTPRVIYFLVQPTGGILLRWSAVVLGGAGISRMNSHWEKGGSLGDLVDTFAKGEFWTQTITFFGLIAGGIGLVYAWVWASGD